LEAGEDCTLRSFITWAAHVACVGEKRNVYSIFVGNLKGRIHSENIGLDGRMILE
jgi:hypothetical protein